MGKGNCPFRLTNFYVTPDTAMMGKLGWSGPSHRLQEDLVDYYQGYLARGGPTKELDLKKDREIVEGSNPAMESIYVKHDTLEI